MFRMKDAKLVSKSLVLLDSTYCGLLPSNGEINVKESPFNDINIGLLRKILRDRDISQSTNDSYNEVSECNNIRQRHLFSTNVAEFEFINELLPPKLNIIHRTNKDDDNLFNDVTKDVIECVPDAKKIGAIGINFDFTVLIDDFNHKDIVTDRFSRELNELNIKLSYPSSDSSFDYSLNISINKAVACPENLKVSSNFHCSDLSDKPIQDILNMNWLEIIRDKLASFDK